MTMGSAIAAQELRPCLNYLIRHGERVRKLPQECHLKRRYSNSVRAC